MSDGMSRDKWSQEFEQVVPEPCGFRMPGFEHVRCAEPSGHLGPHKSKECRGDFKVSQVHWINEETK